MYNEFQKEKKKKKINGKRRKISSTKLLCLPSLEIQIGHFYFLLFCYGKTEFGKKINTVFIRL